MKNKELFDKTVEILVKAYTKGSLHHGECAACVVGNMIAATNGFTTKEVLDKKGAVDGYAWASLDETIWLKLINEKLRGRTPELSYDKSEAEKLCDSTGYTLEELNFIERAFESSTNEYIDEDGFRGLMKVVDALQQIHECTDEERDAAKAMFNKELVS